MPQYIFYAIAIVLYLVVDNIIKTKLFSRNDFKYKTAIKFSIRLLLLFMVLMTILAELGLDIYAFLTSFGITGLAVSLASREVLSNLLSGVAIQINKPFKIGDNIKVKGFEGKVIKINVRDTILENSVGKIIVPNRILLSEPVLIEAE